MPHLNTHSSCRAATQSRCLCGKTLRGRCTQGLPRQGFARRPARIGFRVLALDAAQVFDFESKAAAKMRADKTLKIGIVGFGNFGQFMAKRIIQHGHKVIATSRGDYTKDATAIGVSYYTDPDDFAEQHPDVVILASSILSTRKVLDSLPLQRFRRSTLFVDVLSVKVFPKQLLIDRLPKSMDILCTHPMFGPDSGRGSWEGLNFQYEKVRVKSGKERQERMEAFLDVFRTEGCRMVEMSCEEHDRQAANTQFITHTVGRMLGEMNVQSTSINTRGYESLLNLVENTSHDSFDLYYGLFMYNQNSTETLERLEHAFDDIKKKLFDQLHEAVRQQIFPLHNAAEEPRQLPAGRDHPQDAASGTTSVSSNTDSTPTEQPAELVDKRHLN